ncbi:MAG: glutamine synthetase, partial [Desulfobacteraceae bacterium]|nr:glutamine synthetase [Desulfobacteraceae bacterium]
MTPKDVIAMAKENEVKVVDIRYMDFIGTWQHFSVPLGELSESAFEDGFGFDGSSMRAWQNIDNSDMLVVPEPDTAKIDPFFKVPTLALIGNIHDPITMESYSRDPRGIAKKAEQYLKSTGIGDTIYVGPEPEFFIFSNIRYSSEPNASFFEIDSPEAHWNTGVDEMPNLGHKIRPKSGYFPLPPADKYQDMRTEMMLTLEDLDIAMECQHHEVAAAGQSEIDLRFDSLLKMGDSLAWFKYVLKNVAAKYDHTVTFMPKPVYGDNGTGMHTHMSFWKEGNPLFAGNKYAGMSDMALYAIGGIMKHCKALC